MDYYKVHGDINKKVKKLPGVTISMALSVAQKFHKKYAHSELDELIGAAFLGLCKAASRYQPKLAVKATTYAFSRVKGEVLDLARKDAVRNKRYDLVDPTELSTICHKPLAERYIAEAELQAVIKQIMFRELTIEQRKILYLLYWKGLPEKDAAEQLNCCITTFKKRKALAMTQMKSSLASRQITCP
jgi:RNA polymerase sigma factor (sigma-70 family)